MFLNVLNEEDKLNFIKFVYLVANCDEKYTCEEEEIVNNYLIELGFEKLPIIDKTTDDVLEYFSSRDESVMKIILFEIYGLILSDDKISDQEKCVLDKINNIFKINHEKLEQIKALVIKLEKVYDEIFNVLL